MSGTGWWASGTEAYDEEILARVALDPALLPRVVRPGEVAGTVRDGHGLPFSKGTLVAAGTGDNAAAALGLGLRPGVPVMSLGTSGTAYAVSQRRPADPTGTVAGFADARGDWLPLACTLNCTLAVDRVASLLGLDREAVEPGTDVTLLPFLDGERTPNLPHSSGLLHGLRRHDRRTAAPGRVRRRRPLAARRARPRPRRRRGPVRAPAADRRRCPGTAWQQTVRRLSGRPVQIPEARELVALGAAAQAAGLLTGEDAAAVARRWNTAAGPVLDAVERDEATLNRITGVLSDAAPLLERDAASR